MVVKKGQAAQGHDGEQLHVRGPHMAMRVWENVPRGYHFAPHDCAVDIAGFIIKGSGCGSWMDRSISPALAIVITCRQGPCMGSPSWRNCRLSRC